jgi:hypothetical protein
LHLTKDRHPRRRKSAVALGTAILTAGVGLATVLGSITAQAAPVGRDRGHQLVARNQDGRLEEFYLDSSGSIKHRWQTSPGGSWHSIATVGAPVGGTFASDPAVGLGGDGRLAVFVVDSNNNVEEAMQNSPGAGFTAFVSLGGNVHGTVAVGVNADGRMEIFAVNNGGNSILHAWQNTPGGSFGAFASLGAPSTGTFYTDPSVAINADGRLEVFAAAGNSRVQHAWQTTPGAGWAAFHALLTGVPVYSNVVAVTANADGRLEIFVRSSSGSGPAIWHAWQLTPGGGWHAWKSLGVAFNGNFNRSPVVGRNADGRLEVFTVDSTNKVEHAYQTVPGDGWTTSFTSLDGAVSAATTVVSNTDGRLELFDQGTSIDIQHSWQMMPNAGWSAWFSLGGNPATY